MSHLSSITPHSTHQTHTTQQVELLTMDLNNTNMKLEKLTREKDDLKFKVQDKQQVKNLTLIHST